MDPYNPPDPSIASAPKVPNAPTARIPRIACASVPSPDHDQAEHPEHAGRVPAILAAIEADGLLPLLTMLEGIPHASREQIVRCHDSRYVDALDAAMARAPGFVDPAPTYITAASFDCALAAAGGAVAVVDAILDGQADAGLALVRPPGHHALPERAMGFCLFGNIAIAARHAQARGIGRVMIVDFDVHHGNGTQAIFYEDPSLLFVSLHQAGIYPGGGWMEEQGEGAGRGFTINLPLPALAGDRAMALAFERIIEPAAERFRPELLLVSAGFDAHFRDPLAGLQVSGAGYHAMARRLRAMAKRHCEGRLGFVLEGGYDLPALGNGVVNLLRALLDLPAETSLGAAPAPEPLARVEELLGRAARMLDLD
jgi:acetoin utilization deacetylase AcuC-like enzyme